MARRKALGLVLSKAEQGEPGPVMVFSKEKLVSLEGQWPEPEGLMRFFRTGESDSLISRRPELATAVL
jgi:hypothetical protein